jgi:hypothetical protein
MVSVRLKVAAKQGSVPCVPIIGTAAPSIGGDVGNQIVVINSGAL